MAEPHAPPHARPAAFSAGVAVVRREHDGWRLLILRAYGKWDFPKGMVEPGEPPLHAAIRETAEEASITDLDFRWGDVYCETAPYNRGKVARYYLAETRQQDIVLPISPELGYPEHDAWRWVNLDEAQKLLPPRLQPVLAWTRERLQA